MSGGFSFPPPPPPPPKPSQIQQNHSNDGVQVRGRGRGRGDFHGGFQQRGRGQRGGRGDSNLVDGPGHSGRVSWQSNPYRGALNQSEPYRDDLQHSFSGHAAPSPQQSHSNRNYENAHGSPSSASAARTMAGHKRKLDALRPTPSERIKRPGPETAPAVPGFGAPILSPQAYLPAKPDTALHPNGTREKAAGKALGLVPRSDNGQQDLSDGENGSDVDEEAMYAELGSKLTFEHNGVFTSLKSEADLAAWKKERQKNWPTRDRVAEKDAQRWQIGQERKRLLAAATVLRPPPQYGGRTHRGRGTRQLPEKIEDKSSTAKMQDHSSIIVTEVSTAVESVAPSSREEQLAELRRKVAESEVRNREAKEMILKGELKPMEYQAIGESAENEEADNKHDVVDSLAGEDDVDGDLDLGAHQEEGNVEDAGDVESGSSESSSDVSSDSSSDSESNESAPEEESSKAAPVPADQRLAPLCKYYRDKGWCIHGNSCKYRHEASTERTIAPVQRPALTQEERDERRKARATQQDARPARKSIFQRLIDQEDNEMDKLALQVIKHLGNVGFFAE